MEEIINLRTEEEAWSLLERLISGDLILDAVPKITIGEWGKIDVHIPTERYNAAITPYMMRGWVDLQRSIYRAYSLAKGGEGAANTLSEQEKDNLELIVEVRKGSSDQTVDIQAIIEVFIANMVGKMEPVHVLIAVVALILTWGGKSVVAAWLEKRKEEKLAEIDLLKTKEIQKAQMAALETIASVSNVDRGRVKLLKEAAHEVPVVAFLQEEADKGREGLVKHVTKNDAILNSVPIKAEAGQSITSHTRVEATETRLDGVYRIRKVDTTVATGFRVHLLDRTGQDLIGDVAEVMTTLEDRKVIQDAEWGRVPVFLQINARKRRDEITEATILSARPYDPETDGEW